MRLEQLLNYKPKTIESVLGVTRPTLEQVLGLEPMPTSQNIAPPEPEITEPKKPTIMDRLRGVKDKISGKKKERTGFSNTQSSDYLEPEQDPARVLARKYINRVLEQDNLGYARYSGPNFEPNRETKPRNVLIPLSTPQKKKKTTLSI